MTKRCAITGDLSELGQAFARTFGRDHSIRGWDRLRGVHEDLDSLLVRDQVVEACGHSSIFVNLADCAYQAELLEAVNAHCQGLCIINISAAVNYLRPWLNPLTGDFAQYADRKQNLDNVCARLQATTNHNWIINLRLGFLDQPSVEATPWPKLDPNTVSQWAWDIVGSHEHHMIQEMVMIRGYTAETADYINHFYQQKTVNGTK